jgi:hypothetical protein
MGMLERLHSRDFVWIIPNDDNRVQDGKDLRLDFAGPARRMLKEGVSILEVLVGLSRRLEFVADGDARVWAWTLIENLELHKIKDPLTPEKVDRIDDILDTLMWRTYLHDGTGGFFPLAWPKEDQTQVEIWYQMNAYVNEMPD